MNLYEIIFKKRNRGKLGRDEIAFIVSGFTAGTIPDYQMSAFLMAVFFSGMDDEELADLTDCMASSGKIYDLSDIPGIKVDKHSTGGVGDGTSLVLAPLAASVGIVVPMMSGRGLGHTGGTIDKLESIPGFNVNLSQENYRRQLDKIGVAMIGQSEDIAPADRKMYALRDVTATVDSIPLISASIMSKKLAEGCDALVLDVKTGSGAFMQDKSDARVLAESMISIGKRCGKKMTALITDMNQPLGLACGNSLEVKQAIEVLKGGGPHDFVELTLELGSSMLVIGGVTKNRDEARDILKKSLSGGLALEKFKQLIESQGGDPKIIDSPDKILPQSSGKIVVNSQKSGYLTSVDTRSIGILSIMLGAGRERKENKIDYGAGLIFKKKIGDYIEVDEPIAELYFSGVKDAVVMNKKFHDALVIGEFSPEPLPLIYENL